MNQALRPTSGQCHCGAVSFRARVDPERVMVCHCTDCQAFSAGTFLAILPVPAEAIAFKGTPKVYLKVAESGNRRALAFCPECGTQLYACDADNPAVFNLRLGCVNERAQLPPKVQIWARSAMPWLHELEGVPAHERGLDSPRR